MARPKTKEDIQRRLYAESMGRCMNPNCRKELFVDGGDIIERAHIIPFCDTKDNSFENLIILCPNCHTDFDKNFAFSSDEVKGWKQNRKDEFEKIFGEKYKTFNELKIAVFPLLLENKTIYEEYYLNDQKELWNKFENKILINNEKLKKLLENNFNLFQSHESKAFSNLEIVRVFLTHIDEFKATRLDKEKSRYILFPKEINSMFGIEPIEGSFLPSVESLEILISKLNNESKVTNISIGNDKPYIEFVDGERIFLNDTPRLRQLYYEYGCFRSAKVRLESLNFALKYIISRGLGFEFLNYNNLREILVNKVKIIFVYEYCLSKMALINLSPEIDSIVVNLHNWNGKSCISVEANNFSKTLGVTLLTMDDFYGYISKM
ncbi:HNH endonuclease signature motif containing protein [Cetobacterium somerae]|uniref:HNH endonuclease signature motif containing protein n=1 Tax=Cetobacterium somerae TaxID=188913 RepID=UPI002E7ACA84|nr:HNH endonuclease signature motif containing protein [Cetobacterium somerae]WVJ01621.1 HNH endonuclease signature motif containing protein [Cetobacterium somerae]